MKQCKLCGANLPDESRFCLQCGTPVQAEQPAAQHPAQPLDFIQPALTGGMFLGFFSSLPLISAGNALCCMWVLLGGGVAVVLLTKQRPSGITYGDGAFVGVLSGLVGAIVGTAVQIPVQIISARLFQSEQQRFEEWFRQLGVEGPLKDWLLQMASGKISVATVLFTFFANLLMWSLFAMIGGIVTVAILRKRAQTIRGQTP